MYLSISLSLPKYLFIHKKISIKLYHDLSIYLSMFVRMYMCVYIYIYIYIYIFTSFL